MTLDAVDIMTSIEDSMTYLFGIQKFHNNVCWDINLPVDVEQEKKLHMEYILGIFHNATKLLNEYKWKDNLIEIESVDKHSIIEHSGDVLKYLISLLLLHNIDPIDFITSYVEKYDVTLGKVSDREKLLSERTKIVAFDIDGVIMDYSTKFFSFMKEEDAIPQNVVLKQTDYHFYKFLQKEYNVTFADEERLFVKFVENGGFRALKSYKDASNVLNKLHKYGYMIVLITARPYKRFKRIYSDTVYSLAENDIYWDKLLFQNNKADAIQSLSPAEIKFFVDDRDKHALEVSSIGVPVFILDKKYNRTIQEIEGIKRITSLKDVLKQLTKTDEGD